MNRIRARVQFRLLIPEQKVIVKSDENICKNYKHCIYHHIRVSVHS